jgi:CHAT domain-containing protein
LEWIGQTGIRLISILGMTALWGVWQYTDALYFQPHPEVLPRIWWCATGPLAFLPIHAAGIYSPDAIDSQISEYVISSYTPTLLALLKSSSHPMDASFRLLSVIQPSAPGVSAIPNTKQELENIQQRLGNREHVVLNGHQGTKQRVMKAMLDSHWLHLACHGAQRRDEPTKSALILEDGHLTLEEIIKLDLPKAEFAFLSACQTTTGDESLSDEAVHIAGGMLLAGYRGVVATMWSIEDELAPEVADEFYRRIMEDGERPDNRKAAEALHYSVEKLRKKGGIPLISWIPFVHMGV